MNTNSSTQPRVVVSFRTTRDLEFQECDVIEFTPLGLCVRHTDPVSPSPSLGTQIQFEVTQFGESRVFQGVVIGKASSSNSFTARFITDIDGANNERRHGNRWICPGNFLPIAICPAPGQYNEFIEFQVRNFSAHGLELTTAVTNKFLVRGMILRLVITLPLTGDATLLAKIIRITVNSEQGTDVLSLGTHIVNSDSASRDLIAQYLLQFSNLTTVEEFRDGSPDTPTSNELSISNANQLRDFKDLLHKEELLQTTFAELHTRVSIVRFHGTIVAVAAFRFPNHEHPISFKVGSSIRPDQTIELNSIVVFDSNLEQLLLLSTLRHICNACISTQRTYIAINHEPKYQRILDKCGFRRINPEISVGHPIQSLTSENVGIGYWNYIWSSPAATLLESNTLSLTGISKKLYKIFTLFRRTSIVILSFKTSMALKFRNGYN